MNTEDDSIVPCACCGEPTGDRSNYLLPQWVARALGIRDGFPRMVQIPQCYDCWESNPQAPNPHARAMELLTRAGRLLPGFSIDLARGGYKNNDGASTRSRDEEIKRSLLDFGFQWIDPAADAEGGAT